MRCRLCGDELERSAFVWCMACDATVRRWNEFAKEQHRGTGHWAKIVIECGPRGAKTSAGSGKEYTQVNHNDDPPRFLPPADAIEIKVPQNGQHTNNSLTSGSNADIAFYCRLKSTPGCLSKLNNLSNTMHLYITPGSEAAVLFVRQMLSKLRGLPPGPDIESMAHKLMVPIQGQIGDGRG